MKNSAQCVACLVRFDRLGWLAPVMGEDGLLAILSAETEAELRRQLLRQFPVCLETDEAGLGPVLVELREYLDGKRMAFSIRCDLAALTPFTRDVLNALQQVPYGETISYGQLARRVGRPRSARAVGAVMAHNRWPIVIPCHRVVGADGAMVGYSGVGGVASKCWLLQLESWHGQGAKERKRNRTSSEKDA